ncbi:protoporphyrinogen oxidase [Rufibacter roseus]|uniref:Coproporphyrinogen III oxidase n=1 Tax=Rufibacter roseus TaxID=1567108 RepID=A0ABW2DN21_9BACT|nr:protoporphyrinogen oxidase [Rufibacter roseus]
MRVAIIGAGISGLAVAYYLQKLGMRYDLFEAEAEAGGLIKSPRVGDYQLELGPHSLQLTPDLQELLHELKLNDEIVQPAQVSQNRFIRKDGKYHCLPNSPVKLLMSSFFSWRTKLQIAQEPQKPVQDIPEETISHFFKRRFGQEVVDYLVKPMVAGIYGGDPDQLLLEKTFPYIKEMEKQHGSILKALTKEEQPDRHPVFTLTHGLQALPKAIASKLISLHLDHQVEMVHRTHGKYFLSIKNDEEGLSEVEYDAVIMALPAHKAAEQLEYTAPGLAAALQNVTYSPMAVVHSAYHKHTIGHDVNGFGALHPAKEKQFTAGSIWSSSLFPRLCPDDEVLFSSFVGGTQAPIHTHYPETEIKHRTHIELKANYNISADTPLFQHCQVWPQAIPQPDMFILDVHELVSKLEKEKLFACANWMAGPSVPDCIRYARQLAQKIYSMLPSVQ